MTAEVPLHRVGGECARRSTVVDDDGKTGQGTHTTELGCGMDVGVRGGSRGWEKVGWLVGLVARHGDVADVVGSVCVDDNGEVEPGSQVVVGEVS